jgi:flagellar biosynthesis anti-sigma factor FlgM
MRVGLNHGSQQRNETEHSRAQNNAFTSAWAIGRLGKDQTQLSGAHTQVTLLAAQAAQLPEVREERVQALRQAVLGGRYTTSPEQVAGAMFGHMLAGAA